LCHPLAGPFEGCMPLACLTPLNVEGLHLETGPCPIAVHQSDFADCYCLHHSRATTQQYLCVFGGRGGGGVLPRMHAWWQDGSERERCARCWGATSSTLNMGQPQPPQASYCCGCCGCTLCRLAQAQLQLQQAIQCQPYVTVHQPARSPRHATLGVQALTELFAQ
jgi:hypothetical protein